LSRDSVTGPSLLESRDSVTGPSLLESRDPQPVAIIIMMMASKRSTGRILQTEKQGQQDNGMADSWNTW
jgi:hypothetical protein